MREEEYFGENYHYIWSDGWYVENNKAWFISGWLDLLFEFDFKTRETVLIEKTPYTKECEFRQHPHCIKITDKIICLPDDGEDIWCFHLPDNTWNLVPIKKTNSIRLGCYHAWTVNNRVFIVSSGLKQIIELNPDEEKITGYYDLPVNHQTQISESILVDSSIYIVGSFPVCIYQFNCEDKSMKKYEVPKIKDSIRTFCFDGSKFWLTGTQRTIYIWEKEKEQIVCLKDFPKGFGVWNFDGKDDKLLNCCEKIGNDPLFLFSVFVRKFIWLIPFRTNEIIYINKDTFEVKKFQIEDEDYTEENIENQMLQHKYLLEYVRENRYIGLFSLKNKWIFEIDSVDLTYEIMDYRFHMDTRIHEAIMEDIMRQQNLIFEQEWEDLLVWLEALKKETSKRKVDNKTESSGGKAYDSVIFIRQEKKYASC